MKTPIRLLGIAAGALTLCASLFSADLQLSRQGTNALARIEGDPDNDWLIQSSTNLVNWTNVAGLGPVIAGRTNSPARNLGGIISGEQQFYRALKTAGLYDPSLFRTVSLTFTQANYVTLLTSGRTTGSNVYCSLVTLDNGATNIGAGARYKGNSSFMIGGNKKSINVELDWANPTADLMGYSTFNLNNAAGDMTIQREALYFTVMSRYTPCPKAAVARVNINNAFSGVYTLVQQENGQLIDEWFPGNNGDRWRTPNAAGGGGGGGGFSGSNSALAYLSTTNIATYRTYYDLRTTNSATNVAWGRLINAIQVLNTTPTNQLRDKVEDVLAVDNWLWFLAIENIFADDDSYWNKGADYSFYFEPESGRIHPVEHDGNEAFILGDVSLSPLVGYNATGGSANLSNRPLLHRLLPINELRQRYLAHMRTALQESYHPAVMTPFINSLTSLSVTSIVADPNKNFTTLQYTSAVVALKTFVTNRYNFLVTNAALAPLQPIIGLVSPPAVPPTATETPFVTAQVTANGTNGLDSVWLYHRGHAYGRFAVAQMFDDGAHGDGVADDGEFGTATTNYPAGTKVRFYVEARSANAARAAAFSPARAENETFSYRVAVTTANNSPIVINEVMASNTSTLADPQGEFDDWIELRNLTDQPVDLTGRYLSDEPNNPRKWAFPAGTILPADGYLVIWCDEDGLATSGLHASFKLSASGESAFLTDTDANANAILDSVTFTALGTDEAWGRTAANADVWGSIAATPGAPNP